MKPPSPLDYATAYLRAPLRVTRVYRKKFPRGPAILDEVVTTNRLILVTQGRLQYTLDGCKWKLGEGTQFFVPAWSRRSWLVPGGGPCEIMWCEFEEEGLEAPPGGLLKRHLERQMAEEKEAFTRLMKLFFPKSPGTPQPWRELRMEGELKAMLTRFFESAAGSKAKSRPGEPVPHAAVKSALKWLGEHSTAADVIDGLYRSSPLSKNYLRALFLRALKCSPHAYVERLRMRRARHLLLHTDWQLKRIAAEIGYNDPLYFSRLYRKFWEKAPSTERR